MPRRRGQRFLTTVLFIDLVGSTAVASRLGDTRWRTVLSRFRRLVRAELRRFGGRERDTTGDGFLITFSEPAQALRAAAAIASASQRLGLDVRGGLHTGECEDLDGSLAGVGVHIAARVMALAGPAEVLATHTVGDLVVGSKLGFDELGSRELKGVDGSWPILLLTTIDGEPLRPPLAADEAYTRLESSAAEAKASRRKRALAAALVLALVAVAAAGTIVLVGRGAGNPRAAVGYLPPPTLVRVDTTTGAIAARVEGKIDGSAQSFGLEAVNGTLWQVTGDVVDQWVVERNLASGAVEHTIQIPESNQGVAFGFGSLWVLATPEILSGPNAGSLSTEVIRLDEISGRHVATVRKVGDASQGTIAIGNGAVWILDTDGTLVRIDPLTDRVDARYKTRAVETTTLIPLAGYDWICECVINRVLRFDPVTKRAKTFSIAENAYLIGVDSSDGDTLWLLDTQGATLTPMDPRTGRTGQPLGLVGAPGSAVIANGAIWVAAGHVLDRVDLTTKQRTTIAMPPGFYATAVTADPASHALWLGATSQ